jgi:non-ribosomal peptide synthetase component F
VDVDPEAEVAAWLKNIRAHGVEMRRYEHSPIETVWQAGGKSGTRPFDSVLVYEHAPIAQTFWSLGGNWRFRTVRRVQRTDLPLTLAAYGKPRIVLDLIYDTALFTCETMTGLAACLGAILQGFVAGANGTVSQIGVLPEVERRRVVHDLNRTQRSFPRDACAHHLVEEQARRSPERIALEQGGRVVTYGELDRRAWSAACGRWERAGKV